MLRRSSTSPQAGSVPDFSACYPVSRRLTDLPRHFTKLREQDLPWSNRQPGLGAVDRLFDEKDRQTTIRVLLRSASLQPISTSLQFECCTSSSRSFRRNQDRSKVVETQCRPPYGCTDCICHVGLSGIIVLMSTHSHYWTKRKQAAKTNVLVCSNQSIVYAFPPSVIHLKKESLVCFHTCSRGRKCTIAILWYGMKPAQAKGLVR